MEIDTLTKKRAADDVKRLSGRNLTDELSKVDKMVNSVVNKESRSITPLLKRYYLDPTYKENRCIRDFIRKHVDNWLMESMILKLQKSKDSLLASVASPVRLQKITFPVRKRELPSVMDLLNDFRIEKEKELESEPEYESKLNSKLQPAIELGPEASVKLETGSEIVPKYEVPPTSLPVPELLPFKLPDNSQEQERNDTMLRQVLKLTNFISGHKLLHSRKLQTPVVLLKPTLLGNETPECRKKNLVKKKLTYLRGVFMEYPPVTSQDSKYLISLLDDPNSLSEIADKSWRKKIRVEYEAFNRVTYTIDQDLNITMNKYAFLQPKVMDPKLKEKVSLP